MSISEDYLDYVLDQLACIGTVTAQKMLGGAGIYLDGICFALMVDNILYLKVDDSNRTDYETAGMGQFKPRSRKSHKMLYYEVPVDVLEDQEKLRVWANKSLSVALQ